MRHVDFSPLYRSTVGFDRLFTMLDSLGQPEQALDRTGRLCGDGAPRGHAATADRTAATVEEDRAQAVAGEALGRADADTVRRLTGLAIGGVSPVGHLTPHPLWLDRRLTEFGRIYAAAGTPRHLFSIAPAALLAASGAEIADFTA